MLDTAFCETDFTLRVTLSFSAASPASVQTFGLGVLRSGSVAPVCALAVLRLGFVS